VRDARDVEWSGNNKQVVVGAAVEKLQHWQSGSSVDASKDHRWKDRRKGSAVVKTGKAKT
jgi:hypothetical protein